MLDRQEPGHVPHSRQEVPPGGGQAAAFAAAPRERAAEAAVLADLLADVHGFDELLSCGAVFTSAFKCCIHRSTIAHCSLEQK